MVLLFYTYMEVYTNLGMVSAKDVLGMWVGENESAKYWANVLNSLRNRGVEDIFIACTDNLTGFSYAIEAVFSRTEIQNCIIHQPETPPGMFRTRTSRHLWQI